MTTRVFVLEDHAGMRETLVGFVSGMSGMEVCGAAPNANDALAQIDGASPDLVLVDISLPGMSGLDFLREAKRRWPELLCVMLTGHEEAAYARSAFSLGARGYVAKGDAQRLREAIFCVLGGQTYPQHGV